jgi:hypothetical protein
MRKPSKPKFLSIGTIRVVDVYSGFPASPVAQAALRWLKGAPAGQVYTCRALAGMIASSYRTVCGYMALPEFAEHRLRVGGRFLYGSKRAICALKEQDAHF